MLRASSHTSISKSNPLTQESGMSHVTPDTDWAVRECADAALGDERRTKRLVELANVLGQHPTTALPEACGDGGMLKAAYRFFDNDAIEAQDMLQSHVESTYRRLDQVSLVLAVQDTTEVNWTGHPATQGLGPLGHTACQGLLVHTTLALTPERVPLGLWAVQVQEVDPPTDVTPIEWLLLTTGAVETVDDAIERVQWYSCRWGIEVWHRILKSGCHLEARQFQQAA